MWKTIFSVAVGQDELLYRIGIFLLVFFKYYMLYATSMKIGIVVTGGLLN